MRQNIYRLFFCFLPLTMTAQNKQWSLSDCINYAVSNNISVKKTEVNQQTAEVNYQQAKDNRLPSVSGSASANLNNGSAINQISNERVTRRTFSNNFGISASLPVYQGNKLNLQINRTKLLLEQNELYVQEAKNNITLSVLEAYLQALYSYEGIIVAKNTALSSEEELKQAQTKFESGAIAKLSLAEIETRHANNEYAIIEAENQYATRVLTLKQLLELAPNSDFSIALDLQADDVVAIIPNKEDVFEQAKQNFPNLKIYQSQQKIAETDVKIAKAGYLPTLSLQAGVNTGYSNLTNYNYRTQLDNNFGQTIGASLSIPIFSQNKNKNSVKLAQFSQQQAILEEQQAEKDLYSKIETAWQNATKHQAQQNASRTARDNAKLAYELATKKHEFGGLTNTELLVSQNTYLNAEQTYLQNKYMLALYIQLLNFYEGKEIK
ncbi:MAG: TolC family protein [Capnocytophaga sp.]|nr:TolC family protein [Capnocytophaga sp.]